MEQTRLGWGEITLPNGQTVQVYDLIGQTEGMYISSDLIPVMTLLRRMKSEWQEYENQKERMVTLAGQMQDAVKHIDLVQGNIRSIEEVLGKIMTDEQVQRLLTKEVHPHES